MAVSTSEPLCLPCDYHEAFKGKSLCLTLVSFLIFLLGICADRKASLGVSIACISSLEECELREQAPALTTPLQPPSSILPCVGPAGAVITCTMFDRACLVFMEVEVEMEQWCGFCQIYVMHVDLILLCGQWSYR